MFHIVQEALSNVARHAGAQHARLHIGPAEDLETVRERAWGEVLRQEAVRQGLLADESGDFAPTLSAGQQQVIEDMLDAAAVRRMSSGPALMPVR